MEERSARRDVYLACRQCALDVVLLTPLGAFSSAASFGHLPWTLQSRQEWPSLLAGIITWTTVVGLVATLRNADVRRRTAPKQRALLLLTWLLAGLIQIAASAAPMRPYARLIAVLSACLLPITYASLELSCDSFLSGLRGVRALLASLLCWGLPWCMHALALAAVNINTVPMGLSRLLRFVVLSQAVWQLLVWTHTRLAVSTQTWGLLETALAVSRVVSIRATLLAARLGSAHACIAIHFFVAAGAAVMNQRVSVPGLVEERLASVWCAALRVSQAVVRIRT